MSPTDEELWEESSRDCSERLEKAEAEVERLREALDDARATLQHIADDAAHRVAALSPEPER